jgi:adenylosuccinate synthase
MPVSVVVGGQFGSEGKGKVALHIAKETRAAAVVRVGGPNSGHTGVRDGSTWVLRQLPASALAPDTFVILPAGSLIDPDLLRQEVESLGLTNERLLIDERASVVLSRHRDAESHERLIERIGSTGSGTGASLRERISRTTDHVLARDHPYLCKFTVPSTTVRLLRPLLQRGERVVIEGTQGFGLSIWHGVDFPHATSRDTTAASFVAEAGLAPHDVDDVVLVVRSYPIRVGGNSGPMKDEISWPILVQEAKLPQGFQEFTSATKRVRRIGRFDPDIVRQAIAVNRPTRIALNHMDYVDQSGLGPKAKAFIEKTQSDISQNIDLVGFGSDTLISTNRNIHFGEKQNASFS